MRLLVATAVCCALLTGAAAAAPLTRYTLAGGCFTLTTPEGPVADGPVRMKATRLGEYLLYGTKGDFVQSGLTRVASPSALTEWKVTGSAPEFTMRNVGSGRDHAVRFTRASGCGVYPEAEVNATGRTFRGTAPSTQVQGLVDTHGHLMGFELFGGQWHCGRPWHPYGAPYALPDCTSLRSGTNGVFADFLETGSPVSTADRRGWPTFVDWPKPSAVASEGEYYTALQRAWMGGLRILVSLAVDNEALCLVMTSKTTTCNDMESARRQIRDLYELQDYIDAQSGGPGKGFFRVVTDPFQARRVINSGRLAVVIGIEVSRVLGCGEHQGVPECDRGDVDAGLAELQRLGVATFFPVHKFDNAFGGTKMDEGASAAIVSAGNLVATGRFWDVETCRGEMKDAEQPLASPAATALAGLVDGGALLPVYPPAPHCNTRMLTPLGEYLIDRMAAGRFIVEMDHMDAYTADAALKRLERIGYSGAVSGHSTPTQLSPQLMPRIYGLGGFVSPVTNPNPKHYVELWQLTMAARSDRFFSGGGYGSDMNGLAAQARPGDETGDRISYPFSSLDGRVVFQRERWGQRVFDVNKDGVANYGLYPDFFEQVIRAGGRRIGTDLLRGAEGYLEMWERVRGVAAPSCRRERLTGRGVGPLRLGADSAAVLMAGGQPASRPGASFRYCGRVRVGFVGDRANIVARTGGARTPLKDGLHVDIQRRTVRRIRGGRVRWTAVVTRRTARSPVKLRAALRAARLR